MQLWGPFTEILMIQIAPGKIEIGKVDGSNKCKINEGLPDWGNVAVVSEASTGYSAGDTPRRT